MASLTPLLTMFGSLRELATVPLTELYMECTRGLVAAGKVVGIEVLDHVVLGLRNPQKDTKGLTEGLGTAFPQDRTCPAGGRTSRAEARACERPPSFPFRPLAE